MNFVIGEMEPYMPAYVGEYDPKISLAMGSRDIGLMFGQRLKASMLWKVRGYVKDTIVLINDTGMEFLLTSLPDVKSLSFTFNYMGYPLLAVENSEGVKVYTFSTYGGDEEYRTELIDLPGCRDPKLLPTCVSDLGSVQNQPILLYIDESGSILTRSSKDSFKTIEGDPIMTGLVETDELRQAGITRTGKMQLSISRLKTTA